MNAPTSIADMLAQFSTPASVSPPAPAPGPMPMAPAAPAAPPSGGGGNNNFGAQMQKALPMLLAMVARKQGGPEAGAGLLAGYARGQMQRRQAEQEALELELQTTANEDVKAARRAEFDRKRLMERESWVRTLQEDLAKINDPEQFASFLSSAEKYGAPIHGIQPGELKQQFAFPDARVAAAAKTQATARIDALRKANPTNFDDMLRANAIDRATGKPLQELMATAELLVTDQAGAPMLPTPKDEFQIPNSDAGFDFRVELAAEEERLGRKLKPGERSALRRRLVNEDEARLRGRRVPRGGGSGGGSGAGGGAGATSSGSFIDEIMENPAIYHDMGEVEKRKYRQALSRRGFAAWQKPAGGASNAMAPEKAAEIGAEMLRVARALRTAPGFNGAFGTLDSAMPTLRQGTADAEVLRDRLINLLTLDNMGLIKGVLSESDMAILKSASSAITPRMSEEAARAELDRLIPIFEKASKATSLGGGGLDVEVVPGSSTRRVGGFVVEIVK